MSTFYYWLASDSQSTNSAKLLERMRAEGLGYAVEDRITSRGSDRGPDGMKGVVVCHGGNQDGKLGYWPEDQTWKRIPCSAIWCGMFTAEPPRPDDLARTEQISGEWIKLDDGHRWLAPKARRWLEIDDRLLWDYNLPRRMTLSEDGLWQPGDVKPKYTRLWQMATEYEAAAAAAISQSAEDDGTVRFSYEEIDLLAISALQVNYRVGPVELDLLGVYDDSSRQRIIDVLLDNATWLAWLKKKLAADQAGGSS
jgi:hypothetical protein